MVSLTQVHAYATDTTDRKVLPVIIGIIAVAIAVAIHSVLTHWRIVIPWFMDFPSILALYWLLYALWNAVVWRWRVGPWNLSQIPDLSGSWAGSLTSLPENRELKCELRIKQTWSAMSLEMRTATSTSWSTMAAVFSKGSPHFGVRYEYTNEPGVLSEPAMQIHKGTAQLRYLPEGNRLKGDYYTGRGRSTFGSLEFARVVAA